MLNEFYGEVKTETLGMAMMESAAVSDFSSPFVAHVTH